jgi:hypothetical protein
MPDPSDPDAKKVSSQGTKPNPQRKLWDMPKFGMQRVAAGQPAPALGATRLGGLAGEQQQQGVGVIESSDEEGGDGDQEGEDGADDEEEGEESSDEEQASGDEGSGSGSGSEVSAHDGENGDESGSEAEEDVRELAQRERDQRAARRAALKE